MSYKIDSNNKDPLAELFRKKLENHSTNVDSNGWNEVKKSLGGNKKMTLWVVAAAISAAVIAMLFILSPSDREPIDTPLQGESTRTIDHRNDNAIADEVLTTSQAEDLTAQSDSKAAEANKAKNNVVSTAFAKEEPTSTGKENGLEPELLANIATSGVEHKKENEVSNAVDYIVQPNASTGSETKKEERKQVEEKLVFADNLFEFEEETVKKKEKNWTIAAVYNGSTGGNENVNGTQVPLRMSSSVENYMSDANLLQQTTANRGEGNHYPEMSFSFTVGKRLGKRFAVESGLTYTYLYSKYDGAKNVSNYELKQNLHYIGVPVNATVYILGENSKWNLYASGGVMLEKGIRATYKETVGDASGTSTTSYGESISGVQWSVNASVGTSYELSKSFSVFVAPRLSYYFDNDQPESIRTTKDLSFGVNIGLKYNL